MSLRTYVVAALLAIASVAPARAQVNISAIADGTAPRALSGFGFFADAAAQQPATGVVPYDLITPLFTDYAEKYRFVYVPEGQSAPYNPDDVFALPVGSALIKTFAYPADMRAPDEDIRLLETRVLAHTTNGWRAYPYVWNADMTDADLKPLGAKLDVAWIDTNGTSRNIRYLVPNMNQCRSCHVKGLGRDREMTPIGPEAKHLNHDYPYTDGPANQLTRWTQLGILTGTPDNPDDAPRVARWDDPSAPVDARARAYLDINCAHCHAPDGPAHTSGLYLDTRAANPSQYGVFKRPVAAGRGSGGHAFSIDPGSPDTSILHYRMDSDDPGIMMPELGRTTIHHEGVALIREWIAQMED
ncbi:SO2930 family diheme c-type cytochrome [Pyruvatibacter sp.]|uniref:SO2930 family diheme c-type cytochrome n=1 Tax=Pyruvatibacter sp. TaxID=1981328 RepID=UPI0032EF4210